MVQFYLIQRVNHVPLGQEGDSLRPSSSKKTLANITVQVLNPSATFSLNQMDKRDYSQLWIHSLTCF